MSAQPLSGHRRAREAVRASLRFLMKISSSPAAPFCHLQRLTDSVGVLERGHGIVPRYQGGYRVDDVARGLVVCREPSPPADPAWPWSAPRLTHASSHLSVVPARGWGRGEDCPAFDQHPSQVAALADACMRTTAVTGDSTRLTGVEMSVTWLLGDNDADIAMLDQTTGAAAMPSAAPAATRARSQPSR